MPDPGLTPTESGAPARFKRVLSRGDLILYGLVILTPTATLPGLRYCAAGIGRGMRRWPMWLRW